MSALGQKRTLGDVIRFNSSVRSQQFLLIQIWWVDTRSRSAGLGRRDVAGGDLVFVGGEGCQDFGLLALRHFGKVQALSEFCCDRIKFCGGDAEVPMGLLEAERRLAGLGGRELEGPARNITDPERPHELE